MAAIMGVDPCLFEAARIDGANSRQIFGKITLPLIKPILAYTLITSLIGGIQMFDVPQILTNGNGNPDRTSMTIIQDNTYNRESVMLYRTYSYNIFVPFLILCTYY
jgi:cellobiose transport system permease protein